MTDGLFSTGNYYGTPQYNDWIVARQIDVATFAPDPDWRTTPLDLLIRDASGQPVLRFTVPNIPGRPSGGWALMLVGIDADGNEVSPTGGTATLTPLEVISYSADYNDFVPHIATLSPLTNTAVLDDTAIQGSVEFNRVVRLPDVGGAQNQFVVRFDALAAPAGATEVRLLIKGLRA